MFPAQRGELLKTPIEGVPHRAHRSSSRRASIAANFTRQINEGNDNGQRADDLADCTNRFPIHGMIQRELDETSHSKANIFHLIRLQFPAMETMQ
jgi:hypothetical protein